MPSWLDKGLSAMRSNSEEEVAGIERNEEGCTWYRDREGGEERRIGKQLKMTNVH